MDDTRRLVLTKFKEQLEKEPWDERGERRIIMGNMFTIFKDATEGEILYGMEQLGKDMWEFDMILSSWPRRPDLLCAMQQRKGEADAV